MLMSGGCSRDTIELEGETYGRIAFGEEFVGEAADPWDEPCGALVSGDRYCRARLGEAHDRACPLGHGSVRVRPARCRDCGAARGRVHHWCCGVERCPRCR